MSQIIELSLDEVGHILIPTILEKRLNLSPGMTLTVEKAEDEGLRLRIKSTPSLFVEKKGVLVTKAKAFSNLTNITRNERDRRLFNLLQRVGL